VKREAQDKIRTTKEFTMEEISKIKNFRDFDVWRLAMGIVVDIYECTKTFPKDEVYGLVSQMRRAAVSIASKIARASTDITIKSIVSFYTSPWGHVPNWKLKLRFVCLWDILPNLKEIK
jgi:hypothetical protein